MGTLGHRGHSQLQATQGCAGTRQVSPACPRAGAGAHRVSSGSDSGSRVLGFCSIHRNSIKERSAPTEGAPAPRGGHGGAATARGPRRGATPRTPWCPSVLSTAQHPGPDPAGQRCQHRPPGGEKGTRETERGAPGRGVEPWGTPRSCGYRGGLGVSVQERVERARAPRAGQGHEGRSRTQGGSDVQGVCDSTGAGPEGTAG